MARKKEIVRLPHMASGGITEREKLLMDEHSKLWISRSLRTQPIEPGKIIPAIENLYKAAGLKKPRVVIVPSPLVMAFAYGASTAILCDRIEHAATHAATDAATSAATRDATSAATYAATYTATHAATRAATSAATYDATRDATRDATSAAMRACFELAGNLGIQCASLWTAVYQGGNMWASYECYLTACRDILGLKLEAHAKYAAWEQAAINGGFRVMHKDFCIVSDFPEVLMVDNQNRPHCENGPSHRWRDGWALYHWHGVRVPAHWIEQRLVLDPSEVLSVSNVEQRAAGAAIIGWPKMIKRLERKIIDGDPGTDIGALIELTLPGLQEPGRFLQAVCPRNGTIIEGVPRISDIDGLPINTVISAQAWRDGLPASEYQHPLYRT